MSENLPELIKELAFLNINNRREGLSRFMSPIQYKMECKTIRINPGRATGKTTAIKSLCRANDLIVVHNEQAKSLYDSRFRGCCTSINNNWHEQRLFYGMNDYGWIFIDEPSLMDKSYLESFYDVFDADLFVMLG